MEMGTKSREGGNGNSKSHSRTPIILVSHLNYSLFPYRVIMF